MVEISDTPNLHLVELDSEITDAFIQCAEIGSVLPLLKHELRCKIQVRRLSQGQEELNVSDSKPQTDYELTEEELVKRDNRRVQNKRSANKCRQKEKDKEEYLRKKIDQLSSDNQMLTKKKQKLAQQKDFLLEKLKEHSDCPQMNITPVEQTEVQLNKMSSLKSTNL